MYLIGLLGQIAKAFGKSKNIGKKKMWCEAYETAVDKSEGTAPMRKRNRISRG